MLSPDPGIDELYTAWRSAFARRDLDEVLNLVTPDYMLWPAGLLPLGVDQLRPQLKTAFQEYDIQPSFERIECHVSGDLAVDCGWDMQHVVPRDGTAIRDQRQRVWVLLRRGHDARWRFARGIAQPGPAA